VTWEKGDAARYIEEACELGGRPLGPMLAHKGL
jgi:hypothetical protein